MRRRNLELSTFRILLSRIAYSICISEILRLSRPPDHIITPLLAIPDIFIRNPNLLIAARFNIDFAFPLSRRQHNAISYIKFFITFLVRPELLLEKALSILFINCVVA